MGRRGKPPLPTNILKMRGSWLAKTRQPEPPVQMGAPEKPEFTSEDSGLAWDYLVPLLVASGILSLVDRNALERYCVLFAQWRQLAASVAKYGQMVPIKKGDVVVGMAASPYLKAQMVVGQELRRLEVEFGLTPAARARMAMVPQVDHKPTGKDRFFA